jgi:hypothetical protein
LPHTTDVESGTVSKGNQATLRGPRKGTLPSFLDDKIYFVEVWDASRLKSRYDLRNFFSTTTLNRLFNLVYESAVFVIASLAFIWSDKSLFMNIHFIDEIKRVNIAAAIFASVSRLLIALVVAAALNS